MNWKYIGIILAALVIIFVGWIFVSINQQQANYDELADCLLEKGVILAGTEWCPSCKNQKARFGEAFEKVPYKDCDIDGEWCNANGVTGYPTWIFPNGTQATGVKDAAFLNEAAGCTTE